MHLKAIELAGFKTFADFTRLQFGSGITSIVGPNGSGKSNLVDAVLWVLGERGHKSIRTGSATDVIFSGNGRRRALGMAEVSLTIDNSDGSLPLVFSEVTVTRRVYRDGDSEYLINRTACRLRDIIELFLDSGVGAGSYSIVSQREIDAVLSAKPEDRRQLIEHAAGVQKYRFKREETNRKLERTEQNLVRIRDILHEVESQLAPLEEQAALAREFDFCRQRLAHLTLGLLARDYESRLRRRESLVEQDSAVCEQIDALAKTIESSESEDERLENRLRQMEDSIAELRRHSTETLMRLKSVEGEVAVAEERLRSLSEQCSFLTQEIGILESRTVALGHHRHAAEQELALCNEILSVASDETEKAKQTLMHAEDAARKLASELDVNKDGYIDWMRRIAESRNLLAANEAHSAQLRKRMEAMHRLREVVERDSQSARERLASAESEMKAAVEKLQRTEQQIDSETRNRATALAQWNSVREEKNDRLRELGEVRTRLHTLQETQNALEGCDKGVRAVIGQHGAGKMVGPLRLVADLVRIDAAYERALEALLGINLQILVTEQSMTAHLVLDWLRERGKGRVTLLARDAIPPQVFWFPTPEVDGVIGPLAGLVQCDPSDREFIDTLLAGALLVRDRRAAEQCRRFEPMTVCVTLSGDVFHENGSISGGDAQVGFGFVSRQREIEELEQHARHLEDAAVLFEERMENARIALGASEAELSRLHTEQIEDRSLLAAQEREVEHLKNEHRRLEMEQTQLTSDFGEMEEEARTERESCNEIARQITELEDQQKSLDAVIESLQMQLTDVNRRRDEISREASEVRIRQTAAAERLQAATQFCNELQRQIDQAKTETEEKRRSIQNALDEQNSLRLQIENGGNFLVELRNQQAEADRAFESWSNDRRSLLMEQEVVQVSLREARAQLHAVETERHKIEIRATQTSAEMEDLVRRFREEFSIAADDALPHVHDIESRQSALDEVAHLRGKIAAMGQVNVGAISQQQALKERVEFLQSQRVDLEQGKAQLEEIVSEIDDRTREQFMEKFEAIQREFDFMFQRIFDGGSTRLSLTDPDRLLDTGIDVRVQLPGKAEQDLMALSGGERALTALSLLLALLRVRPSPFCVLDEVDAPLDQSNVGRFTELLREFAAQTQFIVITHNTGTMDATDALYGVTMEEQGVSKLVSIRFVDARRAAA